MESKHPPAFFVRGPSPIARLIFFAAISIAMMAVDSRLHYLTEVRQGFSTLMHPLEIVARSPLVFYHRVQDYFTAQNDFMRDNNAMHQLVLQQNSELQRLRAMQSENEHLRSLLGAAAVLIQPSKLAEIMHVGRDPFTHKIVVNLGTQQGVTPGQAVVDDHGVIGQVTRTYSFSSEVTLITDKELAVPVQIERNGLRAIVFGSGEDGTLELPYLPVNVDIREGDVLVTSGIDGIYPTGLSVARVRTVERKVDSPFAHIACTPTGGVEQHRQVLIMATQASPLPTGDLEAANPPVKKKAEISRSRHAARKP